MNESPKVFDYVKAINYTKENLEVTASYIPFIVNKSLSYFTDTIFYANEMNMAQNIPHNQQFLFYLNTISKSKRFSKWHKQEENEDLEAVKQYFGYGIEKAKQTLKLLSKKQIELIKIKIKRIDDG